jgi:hypothetical protein
MTVWDCPAAQKSKSERSILSQYGETIVHLPASGIGGVGGGG